MWDEWCDRISAARGKNNYSIVERDFHRALSKYLGSLSRTDTDWFIAALKHPTKKWFAAETLGIIRPPPKQWRVSLFRPLLLAAVYEINPSCNRTFVVPAVLGWGVRKVVEALFEIMKTGSDFEIAGAVNALYWAHVPSIWNGKPIQYSDIPTETSNAITVFLLNEFIRNASLDVRRSIIPRISFSTADYPLDLSDRVEEACQIARNSPDAYIRHRLGVQLGTEVTFKALPDRIQEMDDNGQTQP